MHQDTKQAGKLLDFTPNNLVFIVSNFLKSEKSVVAFLDIERSLIIQFFHLYAS